MSAPGIEVEEDVDDVWASREAPKSMYWTEVADDESDDDVPMSSSMSSAHAAATAELAAAFRPRQTTTHDDTLAQDAPMEQDDEPDSDDESDFSGDDDDDDDDELGPAGDGDRVFQAELARHGTESGAASSEGDLLSQILNGGGPTRKGPRQREEEDDGSKDTHEGSSSIASIAEDTVDYQIYSDRCLDTTPEAAAASVYELAALRLAALQYLSTYTAGHIWQKDALLLHVCTPSLHRASGGGGPQQHAFARKHASAHSTLVSHLHGSTYFGDNLDDEWFVVWLLLTLSSHYTDLSILVRDSDGEPIAIEVAESLPNNMVGPESTINRVWIRRGLVHLIPLPSTPAELALLPVRPSVEQSLQVLSSQSVNTVASRAVQAALLKRVAPFIDASLRIPFSLPSPALSSSHCAKVLLPLPCALLLRSYPQLLAEWTNNFFYRDQIDMKRANAMTRILGASRRARQSTTAAAQTEKKEESTGAGAPHQPVPFVFMHLRFTHCLYAQLLQQRFGAPRVFASHIASALAADGATGPSVDKAVDLGVKIAVGAEMWYGNQSSDIIKRAKRRQATKPQASADEATTAVVQAVQAAQTMRFETADMVGSFLSTSLSKFMPTILTAWRTFETASNKRNIASLFQSSTSDDAAVAYWHAMLIAFLYSQLQPHQCVDHESADQLRLDTLQQRFFDQAHPSTHQVPSRALHRIDSSINLPYAARVIGFMDELCEAAASVSEPSSIAPAAESLLSHTFRNLPLDDSEEWMVLTPAELEQMMAAQSSSTNGPTADHLDGETIVDSMNRFVEKMSDVEGVQAPKPSAKVRSDTKEAAPASTSHASSKQAPPKSILKSNSSSTPSQPPASVDVDSNELLRLLSSVRDNPSAFTLPKHALDQIVRDTAAQIAPITGQPTPAPSSSRPSRPAVTFSTTSASSSSESDSNEVLPTKENTRPPVRNSYAPVFDAPSSTPPATATTGDATIDITMKDDTTTTPIATNATASASSSSSSQAAPQKKQPDMQDFMDAMDDELNRSGVRYAGHVLSHGADWQLCLDVHTHDLPALLFSLVFCSS